MSRETIFDTYIYKCGKIHAIRKDFFKETIYSNGSNNIDIALICGNCGVIKVIDADYSINVYDESNTKYIYYNYCYNTDIKNMTEVSSNAFSKHTKIIYDKGYRVPMMNGEYVDFYSNSEFEDTTYPNFTKLEKIDIIADNVRNFIAKYHKNRRIVNMKRFIDGTPDEVLDSL